MTTNWIVKLTHGKSELDLNSGRYQPTLNFVPPAVASVPLIASGTSANRFLGGTKVSERFNDRGFHLEVYGRGSSDVEVARAGSDLANFLSLAGGNMPLYLEVKTNSDVPYDPKWGNYGVAKKFEIVHANPPQVAPDIALGVRRSKRAIFSSSLRVKPFAIGIPQRLASATGTIIEDTAGWKDGLSRGTIVCEGAGNDDNFHTNPVFGNATYNTNWVDGANVTDTENTDERFVLYGSSSVKLVCTGGIGTYTESLTLAASDHVLSYYVKLPDGGTVSATQISVRYNGTTETSTYTPIGDDGWYRVWAVVTGSGGAAVTGVVVTDGYIVYMDGAQAKASSYLTPFVYGDMLGVAWSGTAHASASDATAGRIRVAVADSMDVAEGTIRAVVRWNNANTDWPATHVRFWEEDTGEMAGLYNATSTDFRITDATNTADSAALTFSAGDISTVHWTWSPSTGLKQYIAGAEDGSNATYTPPTLGTYLYLGSSDAVTLHNNATIMDFSTFDRAMTAAEVLADYTNLSQLTADNQRVGSVPYLWTVGGDNVVDNALDLTGTSTGSPHTNYAVINGIPGSVPAETTFRGAIGGASTTFDDGGVWLSLLDVDEFFDPLEEIYGDEVTDSPFVLYSGGGYASQTVDTAKTALYAASVSITGDVFKKYLSGREFYAFARLLDAGSNLTINFAYGVGTGSTGASLPYRAIAGGGTVGKWYRIGSVQFVDPKFMFFNNDTIADNITWTINGQRTTGSANVKFDYGQLLPRPLCYVVPTNSGYAGGEVGFIIEKNNALILDNATEEVDSEATLVGDIIELVPEKTNILFSVVAQESAENVIEDTLTYNYIKIVPRYEVL